MTHLERKGRGTLSELDILRMVRSVAAAQVCAAERRRLYIMPGEVRHYQDKASTRDGLPIAHSICQREYSYCCYVRSEAVLNTHQENRPKTL